jgi:phosphopantetheinyl transferase
VTGPGIANRSTPKTYIIGPLLPKAHGYDGLEVWHLAIADASLSLCWKGVDDDERGLANRFRRPADAERFIASRALTRAALARALGVAPLEITFLRRCEHCGDPDHGRPIATCGERFMEFSATRAGPVVAVVIADRPVGLDAEPCREGLNDLLASRVFSDKDRAAVHACGPAALTTETLALWVAKEAVGKLSGLGLLGADRIRTGPARAGWRPAIDALGRPCWQSGVPIPGTAAGAVATREKPLDVRQHDGTILGLGVGRDRDQQRRPAPVPELPDLAAGRLGAGR